MCDSNSDLTSVATADDASYCETVLYGHFQSYNWSHASNMIGQCEGY